MAGTLPPTPPPFSSGVGAEPSDMDTNCSQTNRSKCTASCSESDSDSVVEPITFMSYNRTGANTVKCQWVRDIASEHDVSYCALQEHFKTVKTTNQWFRQQFREFHSYVIPAYRLPGVDSGRGRGRLTQLAIRDLSTKRARVVTKSPRLQDQILTFPTCKLLWINGYMPCDPQLQNFDDAELLGVLSEVESLIVSNRGCEVLWAADMNWDRSRDNHFTRTVAATLARLNLTTVWEAKPIDYTHTHSDGVSTSTIDHFLVSQQLLQHVVECGPVHTAQCVH